VQQINKLTCYTSLSSVLVLPGLYLSRFNRGFWVSVLITDTHDTLLDPRSLWAVRGS